MDEKGKKECLFCKRTEEQIPLLQLDYKSVHYWICPQHIPILIHQPEKLTGMLPDADKMEAG